MVLILRGNYMDVLISKNALLEEFEWLLSVVNESSKDEIRDVIQRIKNAPAVDAVSRGLFEQYKWERDVAISQLEDLGISFGQKFGCEHCRFKRMSGKNLWCDIFDKIMPEDGYCCFFEFDNVKQEG
jgi:hypothetical protein